MKLEPKTNLNSRRAGERGAALITTLLVSVLLLGAGGALIMTTMMSATNSLNSTPEMQAYYIAESGMQSALNVLRGNVKPSVTSTDRMSFRTAIVPSISNGPANTGSLRLAQWLPYNDPSDPASLVPLTVGTVTGGYRVTVENMDPNSHIVQYQTSGVIDGSESGTAFQRTYRFATQARSRRR
jgi:Tfp pilus assembly protein PilX